MDHLDDITIEDLQRALGEVERKKPTQRLLAAIAFKNGVTQTELAEWYGVERRTIYSWLTRLESEPLEHAVLDARRPGRPRRLTADQQRELHCELQNPPTEAGIDAPSWTPTLVREHLRENFDVEYSRPSCRRLMKEAGLSYRQSPHSATETDPNEREGSEEPSKSAGRWTPR